MATLLDEIITTPATKKRGGMGAKPKSIVEVAEVSAPAQQQAPLMRPRANRRSDPSLLDTIWGVAAGYSPSATRRRIEADEMALDKSALELGAAERTAGEREQILSMITDPRQRMIAMANMPKFGEAMASGLESYTLAPGAVRGGPNGSVVAQNAQKFLMGDQIVTQGEDGEWRPVHTRTDPSISESIQRDRLAHDAQIEQLKLAQGDRRIVADERKTDADVRRIEADVSADESKRIREQAERDAAIAGANQSDQNAIRSIETALSGIDRHIGAAGVWTQYQPWNKQDRANLEAQITALQGVITLDGLAEMKSNSPNGASGMGAMSEREGQWLASRVAALEPDMDQRELQRSMSEIKSFLDTIRERASRRQQANPGGTVTVTTPAQAQALSPGTLYRTPDGRTFRR